MATRMSLAVDQHAEPDEVGVLDSMGGYRCSLCDTLFSQHDKTESCAQIQLERVLRTLALV